MKKATTRVVIFFGIFAAHWVAQFVAWSYAERSGRMEVQVLWKILAAPLVDAAGSLADQNFWTVASLNSALWAVVMTYLIARFAAAKIRSD
jgi:hypothetical protein